ncbi:PREDICTED: CKLF-like MARVEL transmembrane domain-containing protein 7 [Ficedula albicollis]|uniref:CKLF-like MARVEL transmembrane domain-containing protein 7 n=2 Tax=Passeriformes TaxID=9126 RepID=UPI0007AD88F3|nr:PREDICTED: CKLF-like MARVEL transmembrane domain-containing protein 7 [Ficedula albicollis]
MSAVCERGCLQLYLHSKAPQSVPSRRTADKLGCAAGSVTVPARLRAPSRLESLPPARVRVTQLRRAGVPLPAAPVPLPAGCGASPPRRGNPRGSPTDVDGLKVAVLTFCQLHRDAVTHRSVAWISLLIGFISVNNSPWTDYSAYSFFQIVTMCDLVMILFFYIMHIFRVYRKLTCVSWPLAEFLHYLIGTILLLIGSIVAAAKSYNITGLVAGATFGFLATILCVISMWSSYKVSCITQSTNASV